MTISFWDGDPRTGGRRIPGEVTYALDGTVTFRPTPPPAGIRCLWVQGDDTRAVLPIELSPAAICDADTCGMGDERPCPHGTLAGSYCQECDALGDRPLRPESVPESRDV